jgi:anti-anti-sigma factor
MLHITSKRIDDKVILQCQGSIARGDETALLCAAIRHEGRDLTLDLTHVDAIDVAGIGALISLQAAGIYLKLLNPTEPVRRLLKITQLDTILEICAGREHDDGEQDDREQEPEVEELPATHVSISVSPALAINGA